MKKTVVVFLSGGVDSLVTTFILNKCCKYVVELVYFRTWIMEGGSFMKCLWEHDIRLVKAISIKLGNKLHILNLIKNYKNTVVSYMLNYYKGSLTPNPDVRCNETIKFRHSLKWGLRKKNLLATGHYVFSYKQGGVVKLKLPKDFKKDQVFFLSSVKTKFLLFFKFPLGIYNKKTVSYLAFNKKLRGFFNPINSVGLCFFKNKTFKDFLSNYLGKESLLLVYFTLGQKLYLNYSSNKYRLGFYVLKKNLKNGYVFIACKKTPLKKPLYVYSLTTLYKCLNKKSKVVFCKLNHGVRLYKTTVCFVTKQTALLYLTSKVLIVPGQPITFYKQRVLVGSGIVY